MYRVPSGKGSVQKCGGGACSETQREAQPAAAERGLHLTSAPGRAADITGQIGRQDPMLLHAATNVPHAAITSPPQLIKPRRGTLMQLRPRRCTRSRASLYRVLCASNVHARAHPCSCLLYHYTPTTSPSPPRCAIDTSPRHRISTLPPRRPTSCHHTNWDRRTKQL